WMNLSGAVALGVLALDLLACRERERWRFWTRRVTGLLMVACQALLYWLHGTLDAQLQEQGRVVLDAEVFRPTHRLYLWTHTVQWACGVVFLALMLLAWRGEDRTS